MWIPPITETFVENREGLMGSSADNRLTSILAVAGSLFAWYTAKTAHGRISKHKGKSGA